MARGDKGFAKARKTRTETAKPEPKGLAKGRQRAEKANEAGDDAAARQRGKSPGRISRADMRNMRRGE